MFVIKQKGGDCELEGRYSLGSLHKRNNLRYDNICFFQNEKHETEKISVKNTKKDVLNKLNG
jgi:hypothetical protein